MESLDEREEEPGPSGATPCGSFVENLREQVKAHHPTLPMKR